MVRGLNSPGLRPGLAQSAAQRGQAQQMQATVNVKITIRWHRLIDSTCRVKYGGIYY
ncbi:MAG: head-tail adaptor protein, partial [Gammaproteobacteria bacterium]|nr:head-tail adaptor protein [Gammaproteobacteria bacterium]